MYTKIFALALSPPLVHSLMHFAYFTSSFEYIFVFTSYFTHFLHFQRNRNDFKNDDNKVHWWWWGDLVTRRWLWLWHSLLTVDGHYEHLKEIECSLLIPLLSQCCFSLVALHLRRQFKKNDWNHTRKADDEYMRLKNYIFFIAKALIYSSNNHGRIKYSLKKMMARTIKALALSWWMKKIAKKIVFISRIIQSKTHYFHLNNDYTARQTMCVYQKNHCNYWIPTMSSLSSLILHTDLPAIFLNMIW